ncbi:WD repeat-containing protein 97-like isoform X2 [Gigantopelta aegis]|uniref:WD repeat-containing protein 97-like isoform X2 n=1 Tax=Gigantopelta aegis TaxID=1735272 RepID=UPI001B88A212|nr:WD repeat-containing protein 97-like isoform X2 [Gigantopelta aegis]
MTLTGLEQFIKRVSSPDEDVEVVQDASEFEILIGRHRAEIKRKAQYHWSLLRNCIRNTIQAISAADLKDIVVSHGIHHERQISHTRNVQQVVFLESRKEYLTSDGVNFRLFTEEGKKTAVITPEEPIDRIAYASETNQFIGWMHKKESVYLLGDDFEIISQARAPDAIHFATLNKNTGELLTIGPNYFQSWGIRYGARHLIPRLTANTQFGEDDMFSMYTLEDTAGRYQRIFFGYEKGVVVYSVYEGKLLECKDDLHVRTITAMTFFNPTKQLITGAMDGTIKIWDKTWHVKMVFVGHSGPVNDLSVYPFGPAVMSVSADKTIRVWNMETCDIVDCVSVPDSVEGLGTVIKYDFFYTFSGPKVDLWRIQHLYQIHTTIGYRVNTIKMTNHPHLPVRAVVMCKDSSIRIVSPRNGEVITTMMLNPAKTGGLVDAAYAVAENVLFTVVGNGDIIKSVTSTNPCTIVSTWTTENPRKLCNYLLVYEYVVEHLSEQDIWAVTKRGVATKSIDHLPKTQQGRNRTLLLGGRKDGYICVFNWETGKVMFKVEAHGTKGVLSMMANSGCDQLISAGMDNVIKVWRLYPFAAEALAPLMSFYCAHTPAYMSACKSILSVAFQDPSTATFSTVVYHLKSKSRYDHEPKDDHVDSITGMSSCPRMKLFATSSLDGTIRIWNETNNLVRVLKLDIVPYSIGFCSKRGDILLGAGDHLFIIPYSAYMPRAFTFKMMSMTFSEDGPEEPLPYNDDLLQRMDKADVKRLKNSRASLKFDSYEDILTKEEAMEVKKEKMMREEAFGILGTRETDIRLIRNGDIQARHKPKSTKETKAEAFLNYMKLFYDMPKIQLPREDEFPEDSLKELLSPKEIEHKEESYKPNQVEKGFFEPITSRAKATASALEPLQPGYPVSYSGFIPNSILVKLLWPPEVEDSSLEEKPYVPPTLTASQLEEIHGIHGDRMTSRLHHSVTFATRESTDITQRVMAFNWDEEEKEDTEVADDEEDGDEDKVDAATEDEVTTLPTPKPAAHKLTPPPFSPLVTPEGSRPSTPERTPTPPSKKLSSLMSKFEEIMQRSPSPPVKPRDASPFDVDSSFTSSIKSESTSSRLAKPHKPVEKLISRARSRPSLKAMPPIEPPSPVPSPRPATPAPLPDYVRQFEHSSWFKEQVSGMLLSSGPEPVDSDNFAAMLIRALLAAPMRDKKYITEALMKLYRKEGVSEEMKTNISVALMSVLDSNVYPVTCTRPDDKEFILAALDALESVSEVNAQYVNQLITNFLDGDRDIRSTVLAILSRGGLHDPYKKLIRELDSWDIWSLERDDRKAELRHMVNQWLNRWMTSYRLHMKDTMTQLKNGKSLHGRISRGQLQGHGSGHGSPGHKSPGHKSGTRRSSLKRKKSVSVADVPGRSVTVTVDNLTDASVMDGLTYMDAINYFCEMMVERDVEMLKRRKASEKKEEQSSMEAKLPKNTVLVLPKPPHKAALTRLGEMHTSHCKPERETNLSTDYTVPGVRSNKHDDEIFKITRFINLPMKTQYMNPFPSEIDKYDRRFQESILITLKSSQKFFFPENSHVILPPCS